MFVLLLFLYPVYRFIWIPSSPGLQSCDIIPTFIITQWRGKKWKLTIFAHWRASSYWPPAVIFSLQTKHYICEIKRTILARKTHLQTKSVCRVHRLPAISERALSRIVRQNTRHQDRVTSLSLQGAWGRVDRRRALAGANKQQPCDFWAGTKWELSN